MGARGQVSGGGGVPADERFTCRAALVYNLCQLKPIFADRPAYPPSEARLSANRVGSLLPFDCCLLLILGVTSFQRVA